jgi:hypothetical protein
MPFARTYFNDMVVRADGGQAQQSFDGNGTRQEILRNTVFRHKNTPLCTNSDIKRRTEKSYRLAVQYALFANPNCTHEVHDLPFYDA